MARIKGQRQDMFIARLVVDGVDCGSWDAHTGGDREASSSTHRISGGVTVQLGSSVEVSSIKLSRLHRLPNRAIYDFLRDRVGRGDAVVSLQEKDDQGVPAGAPFVHNGVVGTVPMLEYDENSSDACIEEISIEVESR